MSILSDLRVKWKGRFHNDGFLKGTRRVELPPEQLRILKISITPPKKYPWLRQPYRIGLFPPLGGFSQAFSDYSVLCTARSGRLTVDIPPEHRNFRSFPWNGVCPWLGYQQLRCFIVTIYHKYSMIKVMLYTIIFWRCFQPYYQEWSAETYSSQPVIANIASGLCLLLNMNPGR